MSAVGRVLGFLSGLVVLAAAAGALWILWGPGVAEATRGASRFSMQVTMEQSARLVASGLIGIIGLIAFGLMVEAVRGRGRRRLIQLYAGEHESVLIAPSELERQLETVALDAERVSDAQAQVHAAGDRSVSVDLSLGVEPDAEVASVVADVQRRMAAALAARYGIALNRKPKIEVRYAGDREQRARHGRSVSRNTPVAATSPEDAARADR